MDPRDAAQVPAAASGVAEPGPLLREISTCANARCPVSLPFPVDLEKTNPEP